MYYLERRYEIVRGDMIEVYKIFNGLDDLNVEVYFNLDIKNSINRTRGHNFKIKGKPCKLDLRKNYFSLRVVDQWSRLPCDIVNSPTLSTFNSNFKKQIG